MKIRTEYMTKALPLLVSKNLGGEKKLFVGWSVGRPPYPSCHYSPTSHSLYSSTFPAVDAFKENSILGILFILLPPVWREEQQQ